MTPTWRDSGERVAIYAGDCLDVMRELPSDAYDAVIFDPPYNVGLDYDADPTRDQLSGVAYFTLLHNVLREAARVTRDAVVFFPSHRDLFDVPMWLPSSLRIVRTLGWHRREFAGDKWTGGPSMSWEAIIWTSKAERPYFTEIHGHMGRDFLIVPSTHGHGIDHPCPKPLLVMKWLVQLFVPEGGAVLDPFAGSGTTLLAAKELGRLAVGIERSPKYVALAASRLEQGVLPLIGVAS